MSLLSHYALQKAIYTVLSGDTELSALVSGVYDFVPAKTPYPYITIGDARASDESTNTQAMTRVSLTVHVYSRGKGRKETHDIMQQVYERLHDAQPEVEDHRVVLLRFLSSQIELLRDGQTYHGRVQFTCLLEEEDGE